VLTHRRSVEMPCHTGRRHYDATQTNEGNHVRAPRFETFIHGLVEDANSPAIRSAQRFSEMPNPVKPGGLLFEFTTGATAYMQFVHGSPPGGQRFDEPEQIIGARRPIRCRPRTSPSKAGRSGCATWSSG
jgi:hypothetical protein